MSEINTNEDSITKSDILGFCFPVYALGIPRICRNYLKSLKKFSELQKAFVIITAGDIDESGFSIGECENILKQKNCEIIYTTVIQMPINWTTSPEPPYPPSIKEALEIIKLGEQKAKDIALDILNGNRQYHKFNYAKRFSRFRFYKDYYLFKYLGIQNLWRNFRVYDTCHGCKLCSKICPTQSIKIIDKKPVWSSKCEQCMRCVNFCPNESIYQTMGGDTKDKNKYYEPSFNPKNS